MTTIVSVTLDGKMVVFLDRWGDRGVTLEIAGEIEPGVWAIERQSWGCDDAPAVTMITVQAETRFLALRRVSGEILQGDSGHESPVSVEKVRRSIVPDEHLYLIPDGDMQVPPTPKDHVVASQALRAWELRVDEWTRTLIERTEQIRAHMRRLAESRPHLVLIERRGPHENGHEVPAPLDMSELKFLNENIDKLIALDAEIAEEQRFIAHVRYNIGKKTNGNGNGNGEKRTAEAMATAK